MRHAPSTPRAEEPVSPPARAPRSAGLGIALATMGEQFESMLDATHRLPGTARRPSELLSGRFDAVPVRVAARHPARGAGRRPGGRQVHRQRLTARTEGPWVEKRRADRPPARQAAPTAVRAAPAQPSPADPTRRATRLACAAPPTCCRAGHHLAEFRDGPPAEGRSCPAARRLADAQQGRGRRAPEPLDRAGRRGRRDRPPGRHRQRCPGALPQMLERRATLDRSRACSASAGVSCAR